MSQALELVLKRWVDCIKYFVEYIPKQTDYEGTPAKNKRYAKIRKCSVENDFFFQILNLVKFDYLRGY